MFRNKIFLIITHTFATGPTQELRDFCISKEMSFTFLEHPFPFNERQNCSKITIFKKGKSVKCWQGIKIKGPDLFYYIKDFFYTIYFILKNREKYDICIAADNLNTFSAWFLKKIGYINKLIYWTIDYTPQRFKDKLLNRIYHWIDKFCCHHADLLWNSSKRMKNARKNNGIDIKKCAQEIIVPDGCHFNQIKRQADEQIDRFKLVFMGHLIKRSGVALVIQSLTDLLKRYPKITLTIIGSGPEEKNLKSLTQALGVQDYVNFTGYIKNHKDLEETIVSCGLALAPYMPDPNSVTFFSDSGKPKIYLACGLPVLITDVPEIAQEIQKKKAGLIFNYDKQDFVQKTQYLLENKERYFKYRRNAIRFAKGLDWDEVFNNVIRETFITIKARKGKSTL